MYDKTIMSFILNFKVHIRNLYSRQLTLNSGYTCMRVAHKSYSENRDKMHTSSPDYTEPKRPIEPHQDVETCNDVF